MFRCAVVAVVAMIAAVSCGSNGKALLPNVSGKAGEVIVVIDREGWEGNLGNEVRGLLARDCEFLPQREPLYSLVNLAPGSFNDMFKYHRNIVIFNVDTTVQKQGVIYRTNVWAKPQCVIQVNAATADSAIVVLRNDGENIAGAIEQAERNRVIANTLLYEEGRLAEVVDQMIGGKVHFPMGYNLKKVAEEENFLFSYNITSLTKYPIIMAVATMKSTVHLAKGVSFNRCRIASAIRILNLSYRIASQSTSQFLEYLAVNL